MLYGMFLQEVEPNLNRMKERFAFKVNAKSFC